MPRIAKEMVLFIDPWHGLFVFRGTALKNGLKAFCFD